MGVGRQRLALQEVSHRHHAVHRRAHFVVEEFDEAPIGLGRIAPRRGETKQGAPRHHPAVTVALDDHQSGDRLVVSQDQLTGVVGLGFGADAQSRGHHVADLEARVLGADRPARHHAQRLAVLDHGQEIAARRIQEAVEDLPAQRRRFHRLCVFDQA